MTGDTTSANDNEIKSNEESKLDKAYIIKNKRARAKKVDESSLDLEYKDSVEDNSDEERVAKGTAAKTEEEKDQDKEEEEVEEQEDEEYEEDSGDNKEETDEAEKKRLRLLNCDRQRKFRKKQNEDPVKRAKVLLQRQEKYATDKKALLLKRIKTAFEDAHAKAINDGTIRKGYYFIVNNVISISTTYVKALKSRVGSNMSGFYVYYICKSIEISSWI
jgi:hypothetical protein